MSSSTPTAWRGTTEQHRIMIQRLRNTGYSAIALSHTVRGSALLDPARDGAMRTIPPSIVEDLLYGTSKKKETKKKRSRNDIASGRNNENDEHIHVGAENQNRLGVTILRRLNVIIEQPSDLAHYSTTPLEASSVSTKNNDQTTIKIQNHKTALNSYDIIALIPLNDESFTSSCTSTTALHSDIITLDYTKGRGGIQLPYKLRAVDIRAATRRGIAFEVPYGPALVDPSKRRALVRTAHLLNDVCLGVREPHPPRVVLSSGSRRQSSGSGDNTDGDAGVMALRSPGDMKNLAGVVLGWDDVRVSKIMAEHPRMAVLRGHNRRLGKTVVGSGVGIGTGRMTSVAFSVSVVGKRGSGQEQLVVNPLAQATDAIATASIIGNKFVPDSREGHNSTETNLDRITVEEEQNDDVNTCNFNEVGEELIRLPQCESEEEDDTSSE